MPPGSISDCSLDSINSILLFLFHGVLSPLLQGIQVALVLFGLRGLEYLEAQEITPAL